MLTFFIHSAVRYHRTYDVALVLIEVETSADTHCCRVSGLLSHSRNDLLLVKLSSVHPLHKQLYVLTISNSPQPDDFPLQTDRFIEGSKNDPRNSLLTPLSQPSQDVVRKLTLHTKIVYT